MHFEAQKLDEYARQAKETWGHTDAYREFAEKTRGKTNTQLLADSADMMQLFAEFGRNRNLQPEDPQVQAIVARLQDHITNHFYTCTKPILAGLGQMYAAGGAFTENIDHVGGKGTAEFTAKAIAYYCR